LSADPRRPCPRRATASGQRKKEQLDAIAAAVFQDFLDGKLDPVEDVK
jgi:hypothetical protein